MLSVSKVVGFFSDAYCMDWAYAKQRIIRTLTADLLWERIELGQFNEETALEIARELFYGTAASLFKLEKEQ